MPATIADLNRQPPTLPASTEEPVKTVSEIAVESEVSYNPELEISKRRANLEKACAGRRHGIMSVNFRTGLVSRYGVSLGGIPFWTCFMPKSASSSLSAKSFKNRNFGHEKLAFWLKIEISTKK